jgi:hypothetical protein
LPFRIIGGAHQHADPPHALALLRTQIERPRQRRATEQRDERTPIHDLSRAREPTSERDHDSAGRRELKKRWRLSI